MSFSWPPPRTHVQTGGRTWWWECFPCCSLPPPGTCLQWPPVLRGFGPLMTIWIQPALLTSFTQRGGCSLPAALSCKVSSCDGSDTRAGSGDQHHLVSQTGILWCPHHYLYQQQDRPNIGLIKVCLIRNFRQKTKSNRNIFFIILHIQSAKLFIKTWATQHSPIYLKTKSRYLNFECSVFVLKGDYLFW